MQQFCHMFVGVYHGSPNPTNHLGCIVSQGVRGSRKKHPNIISTSINFCRILSHHRMTPKTRASTSLLRLAIEMMIVFSLESKALTSVIHQYRHQPLDIPTFIYQCPSLVICQPELSIVNNASFFKCSRYETMCPYTLLYPPSRHPSFSFTRDSSKDQSLGGFAYGKYGEPGNFGTGYWGRKILGGMTASQPAFLSLWM